MKCPHCQHTFFAGWKAYFTQGLGNYRCPQCAETSRLSYHWWYWLRALFVQVLVAVVPALLVLGPGSRWFTEITPLFALKFIVLFLFFAVIFGLPVDRYLDNHYRPLRKKAPRKEAEKE